MGVKLKNFAEEQKPFTAAFFLLGVLLLAALFTTLIRPVRGREKAVWGSASSRTSSSSFTFFESQPREGAVGSLAGFSRILAAGNAFFSASLGDGGLTPGFAPKSEFTDYKVGKGDTPQKIAGKFGISVATILKANPEVKAKSLKVGMLLQIPPLSGTVYTVKENDTLESIAEFFDLGTKEIISANPSMNPGHLGAGARLLIPGAGERAVDSGKSLPSLKGYFAIPAAGIISGKLSPINGVTIVGMCGTPVTAAAEGLVVPDNRYGEGKEGWNGGYGSFVLLEHPAGTNIRTRYTHLKTVSVGVGDYVKQGEQLGTMGDTGEASGCQLHFEVLGAANPFVK